MGKAAKVITLNVGGTLFVTSCCTLKSDPQGLLAEQFASGTYIATASLDEEGRFFVDRDPKHFPSILNYLRDGGRVELPSTPLERQELLNEARFYKLGGLVQQLEEASQAGATGPRLAVGIPHATETYRNIVERARQEAGAESIARVEGALFSMLFSSLLAPPSSPFNAAESVDKYERSSGRDSKDQDPQPFEMLGRRSLSLYYHSTHRERNVVDRAGDLGAPCAGRDFIAFVKRFFSVLQYDFLQQGYVLQADQRWERLILEIPLGMANSDSSAGVLFEHLVQSLGECCSASEDRNGGGGRALSVRKPPSK